MAYYRSDQALVKVQVQGASLDTEAWDVFEGGEAKSAGLKIFPGGMAEQVELGGTPEREPIKVSRKWSDALIGQFKSLDGLVGNGVSEVSVTPLTKSKTPTNNTITYTGILLEVKRPTYKAGPSEESVIELTIGPNGPIA